MSVKGKSCSRCQASAQKLIVLIDDSEGTEGTGKPMCLKCYDIVLDVIDGGDKPAPTEAAVNNMLETTPDVYRVVYDQ